MHIRRINFISLPPPLVPFLSCLTFYYIALLIIKDDDDSSSPSSSASFHLHFFPLCIFLSFPTLLHLFTILNGIKFRKSNVSSIFRCTHSSQTAPMAAVLFCSHDTVVFLHFRHANAENTKNKTHVPRIISTAVTAIWRKTFFPSDSVHMRIRQLGRRQTCNFTKKSYNT